MRPLIGGTWRGLVCQRPAGRSLLWYLSSCQLNYLQSKCNASGSYGWYRSKTCTGPAWANLWAGKTRPDLSVDVLFFRLNRRGLIHFTCEIIATKNMLFAALHQRQIKSKIIGGLTWNYIGSTLSKLSKKHCYIWQTWQFEPVKNGRCAALIPPCRQ